MQGLHGWQPKLILYATSTMKATLTAQRTITSSPKQDAVRCGTPVQHYTVRQQCRCKTMKGNFLGGVLVTQAIAGEAIALLSGLTNISILARTNHARKMKDHILPHCRRNIDLVHPAALEFSSKNPYPQELGIKQNPRLHRV